MLQLVECTSEFLHLINMHLYANVSADHSWTCPHYYAYLIMFVKDTRLQIFAISMISSDLHILDVYGISCQNLQFIISVVNRIPLNDGTQLYTSFCNFNQCVCSFVCVCVDYLYYIDKI